MMLEISHTDYTRKKKYANLEIPKIIHQTWKDEDIPLKYQAFQKSWKETLPDWSYHFWTDEDNRAFFVKYYDWFLPIYDSYSEPIMRVDAIRYFWMYHYGGLYVDLDFEALQPITPLLAKRQIVIGLEPSKHLKKERAQQKGFTKILCNAFLASPPKAVFWEFVIFQLIKYHQHKDPLEATGPYFLTKCYAQFSQKNTITLLPANLLYPIDDETGYNKLNIPSNERQHISKSAYAIHHWSGSWWREKVTKEAIALQRLQFLHFFSALELPSDVPKAVCCWFRILKQGVLYQQNNINLRETATVLIKQEKNLPLVSCLMITKNRFELAQKAINSFLHQSYPNRELIIIDDDIDNRLEEWVVKLNEKKIRFYKLADNNQKLGTLRNLSRQYANGDFIAQWDDDDFSDANRLLFQMSLIITFGLDGCTLQREQLWFPAKRAFAYSGRRLWEGAFIAKASSLPLYHKKRQGEETDALKQLALNGTIALLDLPELYTYCFHGDNTFHATHFEQLWEARTYEFPKSEYKKKLVF